MYKNCDSERSKRVKLVKIDLKASIINMLCIDVWSKVLIFLISIPILRMLIYLVKSWFLIFHYKSKVFRVKSGITLRNIVIYIKKLEKAIFNKKSLLELLFSLALYKKYWLYTRLIYLEYFIILDNL